MRSRGPGPMAAPSARCAASRSAALGQRRSARRLSAASQIGSAPSARASARARALFCALALSRFVNRSEMRFRSTPYQLAAQDAHPLPRQAEAHPEPSAALSAPARSGCHGIPDWRCGARPSPAAPQPPNPSHPIPALVQPGDARRLRAQSPRPVAPLCRIRQAVRRAPNRRRASGRSQIRALTGPGGRSPVLPPPPCRGRTVALSWRAP